MADGAPTPIMDDDMPHGVREAEYAISREEEGEIPSI